MYHRVSQVSVEEINRVLRLVQDSPSLAYKDRGASGTKADLSGIPETKNTGIFIVTQPTPIGLTSTTPINLSVSYSTVYPTFGWGSNWGNNWGL